MKGRGSPHHCLSTRQRVPTLGGIAYGEPRESAEENHAHLRRNVEPVLYCGRQDFFWKRIFWRLNELLKKEVKGDSSPPGKISESRMEGTRTRDLQSHCLPRLSFLGVELTAVLRWRL